MPWTTKPPEGTPLDPANPLTTGLVGIWPFSEGSGTSVADPASGSPGSLIGGASWTTGQWGPAIALDGSTGYVAGPSAATTYPVTIATWAKFAVLPTSQEAVFIALSEPGSLNEFWFAGESGSPGSVRAVVNGNTGSTPASSGPLTLDTAWHHWACVFSDPTHWYFYLDGSLIANATPAADTPAGITTMSVGGFVYNGSNFYGPLNGLVDAPAAWNRALSGAEVASFYANPWQVFLQGPPSPPPTGTPVQPGIEFQFAQPIVATGLTVTVRNLTTSAYVSGTATYNSSTRIASWVASPAAPLLRGTKYLVTITGVTAADGTPQSGPITFSFTPGTAGGIRYMPGGLRRAARLTA